jgi:hypothetical protein
LEKALQCIPFPGPPDENPLADPNKVFIKKKAAVSLPFAGHDSNARVIFVAGVFVHVLYSPPIYLDACL